MQERRVVRMKKQDRSEYATPPVPIALMGYEIGFYSYVITIPKSIDTFRRDDRAVMCPLAKR